MTEESASLSSIRSRRRKQVHLRRHNHHSTMRLIDSKSLSYCIHTYLFGIIWTKCPDSSNRQLSDACHGERFLFFENSPSSWQQNARRSRGSCFGFYLAPTPESFPLISMKTILLTSVVSLLWYVVIFLWLAQLSRGRGERGERGLDFARTVIAGALFLKL